MNNETHAAPQPGPNDRRGANAAELKADINAGRTGDKVDVFDPGLSMLGTDDEAGGYPMTPEDIALAREQERREPKSFAPAAAAGAGAGAPEQRTATAFPGEVISEDTLHDASEKRFSPSVAIAVVGGAAAVAAIFALMG